MKAKIALSLAVLLCTILALAGCAGTPNLPPAATQTPVVTAAPSSGISAPTASSGGSLVPSPTDAVLASRAVNLNVEKDYLGNVIVTYQGGAGTVMWNRSM